MRFLIVVLYFVPLLSFCQIGLTNKDKESKGDSTMSKLYIERHMSLVSGINIQKYLFGEIGIAIKDNGKIGYHPITRILFLTTELNLINNFTIGPKAGIWLGGGMAGMNLGLNMIYYSNFSNETLRFRPEVGFGFNAVRVVYGYNFAITNKNAEFINKHNFCINILINLKKLEVIR